MQFQTISKALLAVAAGSLFTLGASPAFALDTADLTVKGTIVPAACSANFTGGDTVDFGTIKVVDLLPADYTILGSKNTSLTVTCSSPKTVYFSIVDAQSSSRIADNTMRDKLDLNEVGQIFGLGTTTANGSPVNLGAFAIKSSDVSSDGLVRNRIYRYHGSSWKADREKAYYSTVGYADMAYSMSGTSGGPMIAGQQFSFPMEITAALNRGSALQVASDTPLNGQAVFTINYQ